MIAHSTRHMWKNVRRLFNVFRQCRRGNIAVTFALSLTPMIAVTGAAVDYGQALTLRSKLQYAADAAVLAAGKSMPESYKVAISRGQKVFRSHRDNMKAARTISATITPGKTEVTIVARAEMETSLLAMMGVKEIKVTVYSKVRLSSSKVEVALVLDNTGSMGWGGKMMALKSASNLLIDTLNSGQNAARNTRIGIVPFDIAVNVGSQNKTASWMAPVSTWTRPASLPRFFGWYPNRPWSGLVQPRHAPDDATDAPPTGNKAFKGLFIRSGLASLQPLTNNVQALKRKIASMRASGATYIPIGLAWGWRVLSPGQPFTEGKPYGDKEWMKYLVLMTDGANTFNWQQTGASANSRMTRLCTNIKAAGIRIYTIAFALHSNSIKSLLRGCASSPANFYNASNNSALRSAFSSIAGDINKLRLVE